MGLTDETLVYKDQSLPDWPLRWLDRAGNLVDLSAYTDWRLELVDDSNVARLTKTTGIVGGDGSVEVNVLVAWAGGDLTATPPGRYRLRLSGEAPDGRRRYFPGPAPAVRVAPAATIPAP